MIKKLTSQFRFDPRYLVLIGIILIIWVGFSIVEPVFFSLRSIRDIFIQIALPSIMALGMGVVIAGGGLDMSIGHISSFSAMITSWLLVNEDVPMLISILCGLLVGMAIGLFNGFIVSRLGISSFIVTLGTQFILIGLRYWITNGSTISMFPAAFTSIAKGFVFEIPKNSIYMLIVVIILTFVMEKTIFSRRVHSLGFNIITSRLTGIHTKNLTLFVFVVSGFVSGIVGILLASRNGIVTVDIGDGYLLDAMTMAVFSAVIFGRMKPIGIVLSAIIIVMITDGLNMLSVNPSVINLVKGLILLTAVILGRFINNSKTK